MQPSQPLVKVRDLKTHVFTRAGVVKAAQRIDVDLAPAHAIACLVFCEPAQRQLRLL